MQQHCFNRGDNPIDGGLLDFEVFGEGFFGVVVAGIVEWISPPE